MAGIGSNKVGTSIGGNSVIEANGLTPPANLVVFPHPKMDRDGFQFIRDPFALHCIWDDIDGRSRAGFNTRLVRRGSNPGEIGISPYYLIQIKICKQNCTYLRDGGESNS